MNATLTSCLLAGALIASLAWNFRSLRCASTDADTCAACSATDCSAAIASLDLSDEQRRALDSCGRAACKRSVEDDSRASALGKELFALLAARDVDAARARALADEIGRLRARALRDCVDSVLEVRRVLAPEQVEQLLERCCAANRR